MKKISRLLPLVFVLTLLLPHCKNDETQQRATTKNENAQTLKTPADGALLPTAAIAVDYLRLRKTPQLDAEELATLRWGEIVKLTGEITGFRQKITLRGLHYNDPWVRVQTQNGQTGWVYGGGLSFRQQPLSVVATNLMNGRLTHFLGEELAKQLVEHANRFNKQPCHEMAFAERQKDALTLRTQIEEKLRKHFKPSKKLPDFYWLERNFPTFFLSLEGMPEQLHLFQNFKTLNQRALACSGQLDEQLVQLYFQLFPSDSLEAWQPAYLLYDRANNQTYFMIGENYATELFKKLAPLYEAGGIYREFAVYWKNHWLQALKNFPHWEDQELVNSEIRAILALDLPMLSPKNRSDLQLAVQ